MAERPGYVCLVLQAHQPYVLHHGTWPHGLEWLLEAAAETYLPLLDMIDRLQADGIALRASISLSPVLLEQLANSEVQIELRSYIQRKIVSAREDAAFFQQAGELHLLAVARHWETCFERAQDLLSRLDGDIVRGFREAEEAGSIDLLTSAATYGYAPLLGTDESVSAQFQTAVRAHRRHLGRSPSGVWLPECGYRPGGPWRVPVAPANMDEQPAENRVGVERALSQAGLRFTVVDSHLVEDAAADEDGSLQGSARSLYQPYRIDGSNVATFPRDPRSAFQVWSSQFGYPGDFAYLDFHKKRWPGGHRYWRVTGEGADTLAKEPYFPDLARQRSRVHANHFAALLAEPLHAEASTAGEPSVLCAPFDLELFGHWWHEGVYFLEDVARVLATEEAGVRPITCADYLERYPARVAVRLQEGSWGAGGDSSVWLNADTSSLLSELYAAELAVRAASEHACWLDGGEGERIARQMCRELLLMEASDWPTLITTGAARDYAERRFAGHRDSFVTVLDLWKRFLSGEANAEALQQVLAPLESRDAIFPDLHPADWRRSP